MGVVRGTRVTRRERVKMMRRRKSNRMLAHGMPMTLTMRHATTG